MSSSGFLELIEEGRYNDLEDFWLEQMTSGVSRVEDFLQAAKFLGRNKEKERAALLLGLLAEHLRETENWHDRLIVLKEIARRTHEPSAFEEIRVQIEETLRKNYPNRPSYSKILQHFHYDDIRTPEELKPPLQKIEQWLVHDVGQIFYEPGLGAGRVSEINLSLGLIRMDFESKQDVAIYPGDGTLVPLAQGHILRDKLEKPDELRQEVSEDPPKALGRLLQSMEPLAVHQIKECFSGIVSSDNWSRWWTVARKNPQVLVSGKGAQATYSWTDSAIAAEESVRRAFDEASIGQRIELARQHASREGALAEHFRTVLLQDAQKSYDEKKMGTALEMLELFSRWPSSDKLGFTAEDIIRNTEPVYLLPQIENAVMKIKVLEMLQTIQPDRWATHFVEAFLKEENPRVLSFLFESIQRTDPGAAQGLIDRLIVRPFLSPAAFSWICQQNFAASRGGKLLLALLSSLDDKEFSAHKNKLKKVLEGGLLMSILDQQIEPETAKRAIELLDHSLSIEDYRKARLLTAIRMRFPELKKKEEWIFSTKEALERKRVEIDHLIKVELPANRKAVGEAAALGDLSENHEYKAARERQDYLINRLQQLQNDLSRVRVLEPGQADPAEVRPGTRVTLLQPPDNRLVITLLGPWDSNPKEGIYSYQSPAGASLMGKLPGDQITWNESIWTIERIDPWT